MRLSDNPHYRQYGALLVAKDYGAAREALERCILDASQSPPHKAFLLQQVAMTYFHQEDLSRALEYFRLAEAADPTSLLVRYEFAKFLANSVGDYEGAIAECDKIGQLATEKPFDETEEDFGSTYYQSKAEDLRRSAMAQKAGH
jgi:tetratricopeptide (TPR) repeat protein